MTLHFVVTIDCIAVLYMAMSRMLCCDVICLDIVMQTVNLVVQVGIFNWARCMLKVFRKTNLRLLLKEGKQGCPKVDSLNIMKF